MQKIPLVTIGVPVRNGGDFLSWALESISQQNYPNIEIIISDNGSTDGTAGLIESYAANDSRVIRFRHDEPLTAYDNFMFLLDRAQGKYFMWAAHDDTRSDDFVNQLVNALEHSDDAVLAFPDLYITSSCGDNGEIRNYDFKTTELFPLARMWKASRMQCYHIYGLWRTDKLRRAAHVYCSWWPDLPIMTAAAFEGKFIHVDGARFTYYEILKTSEERVGYQDHAIKFNLVLAVMGLVKASFVACRQVGGVGIGLMGALFVFLTQAERAPGVLFRKLKRRFSRKQAAG